MINKKLNDILDKILPSFIFIILALSILKYPFGFKVYLNIIPILLGLFYILVKRNLHNVFTPMLVLLFLGTGVSLYFFDIKSFLRLSQVLCMLGFATFMIESRLTNLNHFFRVIFSISILIFVIEFLFFKNPFLVRSYLGFNFYRLNGPVGEVNYSGILLSLAGVLALFSNNKKYYFIACLCWFFTFSRTSLLVLIIGPILLGINYCIRKDKVKYWINNFLLTSLYLTPAFIYLINHFFALEAKVWLENMSSGRLYLMIPYVNMGLDYPLGVGYFRGLDYYAEYLSPIKELVNSIRNSQINEQHSIFIQVFSEFGFIGYGIFVCFLINLVAKIREKHGENEVAILLCALIGYSLLNGLNDMIFYLIIAYSLRSGDWSPEKKDCATHRANELL